MYTSFKSKGRGPGILRRSLIKNIGCPCCHPFRDLNIYCSKISTDIVAETDDDDGT